MGDRTVGFVEEEERELEKTADIFSTAVLKTRRPLLGGVGSRVAGPLWRPFLGESKSLTLRPELVWPRPIAADDAEGGGKIDSETSAGDRGSLAPC